MPSDSQYAEITTPIRTARFLIEPTNWGQPYQALFNQTDLSGGEYWLGYASNNFKNPLRQADEDRRQERDWHSIMFHDTIEDGGKGDVNGKRHLIYTTHAGIPDLERRIEVYGPKSGWYVPTESDVFYTAENGSKIWIPFHIDQKSGTLTLIPRETVPSRQEAQQRLEAKGIPIDQASYFYRPDTYDSICFARRVFGPVVDGGRFYVLVGASPSGSGSDEVASLPAYREAKQIFRAKIIPQEIKIVFLGAVSEKALSGKK